MIGRWLEMMGNCLEINCLEMFGNSVILWWQDHVLGHLSYLPPHALYKSGFCWICNGTFNCGLRMARDRLVILRWTGNDWKWLEIVWTFFWFYSGGMWWGKMWWGHRFWQRCGADGKVLGRARCDAFWTHYKIKNPGPASVAMPSKQLHYKIIDQVPQHWASTWLNGLCKSTTLNILIL